jgi:uncharacterized membrane protein YcaP (DUF421 family)
MGFLIQIFGEGGDLNALQMSCRAVVIFLIALVFIRISGRRSFGIRTPLDNIIVVLLGAVLSRAVTGASPFWPTICAGFMFVFIHRIFGWIMVSNKHFKRLVEGDKILLYDNGRFIKPNLRRGLVSQEDILQGIREAIQTDDLEYIKTVYIERNGTITVIKKDEPPR